MSSIDATLAERGSRYGEFVDHADVTQRIKDAMKTGNNWFNLDVDMIEALEMVAHKIGRILNGDPKYIDSWTDIIGYTRLVEKRLITEQEVVKGLMAGDSTQATTFGPLPTEAPKESKFGTCGYPGCKTCADRNAANTAAINEVSLKKAVDEFLQRKRPAPKAPFSDDEVCIFFLGPNGHA